MCDGLSAAFLRLDEGLCNGFRGVEHHGAEWSKELE